MRIVKLPPERWMDFKALRLEALHSDPNAFGATYKGTLERPDEWWITCLENAQSDPTKTLVFAENESGLIGMAGAYPEQDPEAVDIVSMYVKPSLRGQGIGRALLEAVVAEVRHKQVRLCVNDDQTAAVDLYRRFGFRTIAETPLERADGTSYVQLYMALGAR